MSSNLTKQSMTWAVAFAVILVGSEAPAATLWWVGDDSAALYGETNWSTVDNNAASEPAGNPVDPANTTDDLVIADLYNGSPIANPPGGSAFLPFVINQSGISTGKFTGNTITLSGTSMAFADNNIVDGDAAAMPTFNLDNGAQLAAEAIRRSNINLADTAQALFWGTGSAIFTDSVFDLQSGSSSLRLVNLAPGTDLSAQFAGAGGFAVNGTPVSGSDLLASSDGNGGTLLSAPTIYWVGDGSNSIFAESNWSAVSNNAGAEPIDPSLIAGGGSPITVDMIIADTYNGSAIANTPGGGPIDDPGGGLGDDLAFSGNTVTISGTTVRLADNHLINGDPSDRPIFDFDTGAILAAEAVQDSIVNLADTAQVIFWGTGPVIFDGSTFNFKSLDASLRLLNIAFGTDIATQLGNAAGFEYMGSAIGFDDLLIAGDGEGGTLIRANVVIPAPAALPAGLGILGLLIMRRK